MCVALPGIVVETGDGEATVDFNGNRVKARSGLVEVKNGDHVLVHAGCILQKVSSSEAEEMTELMKEMGGFGF